MREICYIWLLLFQSYFSSFQRQAVSPNSSQIGTVAPGMITFPAGQSQARIVQQGGQQFLMHGAEFPFF